MGKVLSISVRKRGAGHKPKAPRASPRVSASVSGPAAKDPGVVLLLNSLPERPAVIRNN